MKTLLKRGHQRNVQIKQKLSLNAYKSNDMIYPYAKGANACVLFVWIKYRINLCKHFIMHKPVKRAPNQALFTTVLFPRQFKSLFYDWFKKTDHKRILHPLFYFDDGSSQPLENFHKMEIHQIDSCAEAKNI